MKDHTKGFPAYEPGDPQPARLRDTEMSKTCPHCKEEIPQVPCCYHCQRELTATEYTKYRISCQRCKDADR